MAAVDPSLAEPTATTEMAYRTDAYLIAVRLLRDAEMLGSADPEDVLFLAQFLAG